METGNKITILIVDDEKTAHQLYKIMLQPEGYTLLHAENGQEAVDIFRKNPDIKLILMDIKMPVMDGYEATRQIRKIDDAIPVVAQTAYSLPADKKLAIEAGCTGHLAKPVSRKMLTDTIQKYT